MFKKSMRALTPRGQTIAHRGKGSQMTGMPQRGEIDNLARNPGATMNDYAKTTPLAQPAPAMSPPDSPYGF